uniref:Aldolase FrzH n=1 Tax=Cladobotryum sp. TaxID=2040732 RepID=FRZH_CLASX|nr:FrzH [Cladobotryum sp.]
MAKHITSSEYDAVIATAYCYVEAMEKGSSKRAKEGFHPDGGIYGYVDGEFKGGSISNLFDFLDQSPEGHKIKAHLDVIAMTPTTAIVKTEVEMNPPETDYTDFLGMVKIDGKWQIVSKIFHSYPR